MLHAALTTAAGRHRTRDCAATASMSMWSMIATSPGWRRLVRFFVRPSTRAGPVTPGPPSGAGRGRSRGILTGRWSHGAPGGQGGPLTLAGLARPAAVPGAARLLPRARRPVLLGRLEQLLGVRLGGPGVRHPSEHAGELAHAPLRVQRRHAAHRDLAVAGLHHGEVAVRERGDLGEVGDDEDLRGARQAREPAADAERRAAADAGVDLVEDERRNGVGGREYDLESEHDAGQLPARG